jgi:hypothetical protein
MLAAGKRQIAEPRVGDKAEEESDMVTWAEAGARCAVNKAESWWPRYVGHGK